jgi:hypothetical protein
LHAYHPKGLLDEVLKQCGMENAKSAPTPLPAGYVPAPNKGTATPELQSWFQTVIGLLIYIMLGTCPDIAFAVTKLAQFLANPSQDHVNKALHVCHYLISTRKYCLVYNGESGAGLIAYSNSDWASDPNTRQSQSGYFLMLAGGIVSWTSHAQKTIAFLSTEAEYMSISDCSRQVKWVKMLLSKIGYKLGPIPICGDNQGSIFIASNPVTEKRSKHIDIHYQFICEVVEDGYVDVAFIDGDKNPADMFTKNLGCIKFDKFCAQLRLQFKKI